MLDYLLNREGEPKKVGIKMVEHEIQMHAHKGSGSDFWIIVNNLTCERRIVDLISTGKGNISLQVFHGNIGVKKTHQYL